MHRVSVVILTLNKRDYTRACLASLLRTQGVEVEAVVVDNGSTDGTPALLAEMKRLFADRGWPLRIHANGENVGCCTARNQGLDMAYGDYVAFLDNDTIITDPLWAELLIGVIESNEKAALVGPKLVYPVEPHLIQCAGVGVSQSGRVQFRGRGATRDTPEFDRPRECQGLISACFLFPYWLYEEIGGMDEVFNPIEYEDLDFCYRARSAGYGVFYEPSVEVEHWESVTSEGTESLPNTYLIIKHGLIFKERWRSMFEHEGGPSDEECRWRRLTVPSLGGPRER